MIRFNSLLAIGASALLVTACSSTPTAENPAAPIADAAKSAADTTKAAADKAATTATGAADKAKGAVEKMQGAAGVLAEVKSMKDVVSKTTAAVGKKDFPAAQAEFGKFSEHWSKVEGVLKTKSGDSYKKIGEEVTAVKASLQAKDPVKSISSLQALSKTIGGVVTQMGGK
jgi:nucleoid-associated protein YgaU